jgi:hypothetical protein
LGDDKGKISLAKNEQNKKYIEQEYLLAYDRYITELKLKMKNLYPNIDFEIGGVIEDETKE